MEISGKDIIRAKRALNRLLKLAGKQMESDGYHPITSSKLGSERKVFPKQTSIETAYSSAAILIESIHDHIHAFIKTITKPASAMAPFTCIRGALEASAVASWLLDDSINGVNRVKRSIAYRFHGLNGQLKLARAMNSQHKVDQILHRIDELEAISIKLEFKPIINSKGKKIGLAMKMPSITDMIRDELDCEPLFRLTSSMAHGAIWAFLNFSFARTNDRNLVEKHIKLEYIYYLCCEAAFLFSYPLWKRSILFGFDQKKYVKIFSSAYMSLKINNEERIFWNKA